MDTDAYIKAKEQPGFLSSASSNDIKLIRMNELYDDIYGFVDMDNEMSPLAHVLYSPKELNTYGDYGDVSLSEYIKKEILQNTGITYDRWMEYPRYRQERIIETVRRNSPKNANAQIADLNKIIKSLTGE